MSFGMAARRRPRGTSAAGLAFVLAFVLVVGRVGSARPQPPVTSFDFRFGGVSCRLVASGEHEWRLLTAGADGEFATTGACQQLAHFMGEPPPDEELPLSVRREADRVRLSHGGSSVEVGPSIRFYRGAEALPVVEITSVSLAEGVTAVTGTLDPREGVFGGGERFDAANRRGTTMDLYTGDFWNSSSGSYVAIPLFLFTRGAGVFLNAYERVRADLGTAAADAWTLATDRRALDLYVFTNGMKAALGSYARLSGRAAEPTEWNYGPLVCRYGPDFAHLRSREDRPGTTNKDGAPSGRGLETIVTGYEQAAMPVRAVIVEGWGFQHVAANPAEATRLKEAADWLHARGTKLMLYMRVASQMPTPPASGFSERFLLEARITEKGRTVETFDIPDVAGSGINPDAAKRSTHRYLDITDPAAMDWYLDRVWGEVVDLGVDGVKIDFCETLPDAGRSYHGVQLEYRWHDASRIARGTEHHAFPTFFTSAFRRRMNERKPGFMVLARGGGIGAGRNPFMWAGDQCRDFGKLDDALLAVVTSGLSGVPFMTFDMAGYRYGGAGPRFNAADSRARESRIFERAVQYAAFTPCIQTHGTVRNAYELDAAAQATYRRYVGIHEKLLPYIGKLAEEAAAHGVPPVRHPALEFPADERVRNLTDVFMLGDAIYVAPILGDRDASREVYLPPGRWRHWCTGAVHEGPTTFTVTSPDDTPAFVNLDATQDVGL